MILYVRPCCTSIEVQALNCLNRTFLYRLPIYFNLSFFCSSEFITLSTTIWMGCCCCWCCCCCRCCCFLNAIFCGSQRCHQLNRNSPPCDTNTYTNMHTLSLSISLSLSLTHTQFKTFLLSHAHTHTRTHALMCWNYPTWRRHFEFFCMFDLIDQNHFVNCHFSFISFFLFSMLFKNIVIW